MPQIFQDRIERFNRLFTEGTKDSNNPHNFEEDDLYKYESFCIEEALKINEAIPSILDLIKEKGRDEAREEISKIVSDDHSGNTFGQSVKLARCYQECPNLIPYMHGALAQMVGDEGYYDDRSDLPEQL